MIVRSLLLKVPEMALVQPLKLVPEEIKPSAAHDDGADNNLASGQIIGSSEAPPSTSPQNHCFDPGFTQTVINATGPNASPRMRKVMASLIQHVHDFARENEITVEEWMAGVEMVNPLAQNHKIIPTSIPSQFLASADQPSRPHVHRLP